MDIAIAFVICWSAAVAPAILASMISHKHATAKVFEEKTIA